MEDTLSKISSKSGPAKPLPDEDTNTATRLLLATLSPNRDVHSMVRCLRHGKSVEDTLPPRGDQNISADCTHSKSATLDLRKNSLFKVPHLPPPCGTTTVGTLLRRGRDKVLGEKNRISMTLAPSVRHSFAGLEQLTSRIKGLSRQSSNVSDCMVGI